MESTSIPFMLSPKEAEARKLSLSQFADLGMMDCVDAAIEEMNKKVFIYMEHKVLQAHKYKITQTCITRHGKEVHPYQTQMPDKKRPRRDTYEDMIKFLFQYYFPDETPGKEDYSFKGVFEAALEEKQKTENPKQKTIRDYQSSYKAFVSDELAKMDIRKITQTYLKEYIMTTVLKLNLTAKRLNKLKSLLNLVFRYATDLDHQIITVNPVPTNNNVFKKNCRINYKRPEEKAFQPEDIERIKKFLWERTTKYKYNVNTYAILFSIETGVREGEIPALKWSDIHDNCINIHAQQNDHRIDGKKVFYYEPCTKNEKGVSHGGRNFPLSNEIIKILKDLKERQESLGIETEWIFAKEDGEWITTDGYASALRRLAETMNLPLRNNHAFRMALNSYVFIDKLDLSPATRAKLLGHSPDTNIKHYTFAKSDAELDDLKKLFDSVNEKSEKQPVPDFSERYPKIIAFQGKVKTLENREFSRVSIEN